MRRFPWSSWIVDEYLFCKTSMLRDSYHLRTAWVWPPRDRWNYVQYNAKTEFPDRHDRRPRLLHHFAFGQISAHGEGADLSSIRAASGRASVGCERRGGGGARDGRKALGRRQEIPFRAACSQHR